MYCHCPRWKRYRGGFDSRDVARVAKGSRSLSPRHRDLPLDELRFRYRDLTLLFLHS